LPAKKNTPEIANIRNIKPYIDVLSPPSHKAFSDARGLLEFIKKLRDNADGKPVGFKLCVGDTNEFEDICKEMINTGIKPDFITVDGGEGGTERLH
jgi:glutamate synthase domain-containing protein 2